MRLYAECDGDFIEDYEAVAKRILEYAVAYHKGPEDFEVSLYITDDETVRETNRDTRNIDSVTDVLSFPNLEFAEEGDFGILDEYADSDIRDPENGDIMLGEIMICRSKVYSQAEEYGHSPLREYAFLLTHSILHLMGYDHMEDVERERMEEKQRIILDALGYVR